MSPAPVFLTVEHILAIHRRMIQEFGGDPGLRDRGLLESAAAMPSATFDGALLHADIPAMAAAYLFHLCRNHPFVDGNKRVALTATEVFLALNGFCLALDDDEVETVVVSLASGRTTKEGLTRWIAERIRKE